MLDLDYAFLADYAAIQEGKLTTVGASFTRMRVPVVPTQAFFAVAGRIRCDEPDRQDVGIRIRVVGPGDEPLTVEAENRLDISETTNPPYDAHRRGTIFALQVGLPILVAGTYSVSIDLEDTEGIDRLLRFEVESSNVTDPAEVAQS